MKIYTKSGDDGTTGLLYGGRVDKDDPRTHAYGTIDEGVAAIGLARSFEPVANGLTDDLLRVQRELFVLGAELAAAPGSEGKLKPGVSKVTQEMVGTLEQGIDEMTSISPLPNYFIVPGSNRVSAALDQARAIVRRAERIIVQMNREGLLSDPVVLQYVNRLSDFLFVAARHEEHALGLRAPSSKESAG